MLNLKVNNLTIKLVSNYYFYSLDNNLLKDNIKDFSKFINDYFPSEKGIKNLEIMTIIDIFNNSTEIDTFKKAKELFQVIISIDDNNKNFFIKYLERIINIYVDFEDQQYITTKYFIFCHFYLEFVKKITINYIPYPINQKINYQDINNKDDYELDNI